MANLADVNPSLLQNVATQLPQGQHRGLDQQELTRALIRQQQQQQQQQQHGVKVGPRIQAAQYKHPSSIHWTLYINQWMIQASNLLNPLATVVALC